MTKRISYSVNSLFSELIPMMETKCFLENKKYQKLIKQEESILDEYEHLRALWDDREPISLSKEEIDALIQLRNIVDKRLLLISEYMFIQGVKFHENILR